MIRPILLLSMLAATPALAEEAKWVSGEQRFPDAPACAAHLQGLVAEASSQGYEAVRGPYEIAAGDTRIHMVRAEGSGHRIWEYRCVGQALASRTWHHSMENAEAEFTVDSVAGKAEWLKKDAPEQ